MKLHEIEELIKTVNRKAIKAMLRNAAILGDAKATDEMRSQAIENVKAIAANKSGPKKAKVAKPEAQVPTQLTPAVPAAAAPPAATPAKIEYPQGLHLTPLNSAGHDEAKMRQVFDALPDHEKQHVVNWHSTTQMKKSVDALYNLFSQLKKHL